MFGKFIYFLFVALSFRAFFAGNVETGNPEQAKIQEPPVISVPTDIKSLPIIESKANIIENPVKLDKQNTEKH